MYQSTRYCNVFIFKKVFVNFAQIFVLARSRFFNDLAFDKNKVNKQADSVSGKSEYKCNKLQIR